ncbi:zinc-binding dehydrogenase [Martelella sp. AD-3]|uniref:quinone oxidoreductase family protein n=1 Tax=Martelella sp. AD-3 TaxID=686597 RepID=UPI000466F5D3|nr:zinc-binding dehydrogenase [Martelella sp. AD-3]AMM84716.1 hypothetical protein AZF01_10425 [Martelella sp. AD-3]
MQAIIVKEFGAADQLCLASVPAPSANEGEIVIDVEAAGVGLLDVLQRRGLFGGTLPGFVPGVEVAGTVARVGAGVDAALVGKRVFALGQGGYAQQFVARSSRMVVLPENVSPAAAVSLGTSALVARFSIRRARLQAGESVLVRGASGGIGSMTVQMAVNSGAVVTALTNAAAADRVGALGAEHVIRRGDGARPDGPFDVIIDPVAGDDGPDMVAALKPNGRYLVNGAAAGFPPSGIDRVMLQNFSNSLTYSLFSLDSVRDDELVSAADDIFSEAAGGALRSLIAQILPLHQAPQAHEMLESGGIFGKIVLQP